MALALYAVLAVLSWFTLDGTVLVGGRPVELRLLPLIIIGGLALRTVLALQAEKIRREEAVGAAIVALEFALRADVAQLVEHSLGKGEVTSSILVISSRNTVVSDSGQSSVECDRRMSFVELPIG